MVRTVTATAPVRVCDLGGWTDTWFAGHGLVVNVAVEPGVTARVTRHRRGTRPAPVTIDAPDLPGGADDLLWAVVDHVGAGDEDLEIAVAGGVPPGAAMGTSASVTVALLAALRAPAVPCPAELAAEAHAVEVARLGREGGVQDQVAAAHGGISRIDIDAYPAIRVTPVPVPPGLAEGLRTVYLGAPHASAAVHERVIDAIAAEGPGGGPLERLRRAAADGCEALAAGDLVAFGRAMRANTDAQAELAPGVVGDDALAVIEAARAHGALGWKVNGAGGPGGTVTALLADGGAAFEAAVAALGYRVLPVTLSPGGVRVRAAG
jgi:D-glycero-alpha-D-manno-heptose-7-phosphate kinase